jgi:hypothetical protein
MFWDQKSDIPKDKELQPFMLTCKVPPEFKDHVPESVSVVENPCDNATNNLKVIYNQPPSGEKKNFGVCVKGLFFPHQPEMTTRLVEWIELIKILGAEKITLYELAVG